MAIVVTSSARKAEQRRQAQANFTVALEREARGVEMGFVQPHETLLGALTRRNRALDAAIAGVTRLGPGPDRPSVHEAVT